MQSSEKKKFSFKKFLKRTGIVILILYAGLCAYMYFAQDSMLFHPQPLKEEYSEKIKSMMPVPEALVYTMADGSKMKGWFVKDTSAGPHSTLICFPGNAEEISHMIILKDSFPGCNLVLMNYRGFGESEGKPSEKNFFSDALEIYDAVSKRNDVDPEKIVAYGRSIGTGVATYLSSKRKVISTVLVTPYESMATVAQSKYPFIPVKLLIKHPFKSEEYAKEISTPVLVLIASEDRVIPPAHAEALASVWKGKVTKKTFQGAEHNNIMSADGFYNVVRKFITHNQN